jgi:hypothetical protein
MTEFILSNQQRCLLCNCANKTILDMSINRPFRNNENVITFAICKDCLKEIGEVIEMVL